GGVCAAKPRASHHSNERTSRTGGSAPSRRSSGLHRDGVLSQMLPAGRLADRRRRALPLEQLSTTGAGRHPFGMSGGMETFSAEDPNGMRHMPTVQEPQFRPPPLVEPADELSFAEIRRYSRHLIIPDVAMTGQKRMKNAKVLCI